MRKTSDTARLDAELLLAHALDIERDVLLLAPPTGPAPAKFADLVARRAEGEPIAYITGKRAFWNIELKVGPGALIPRPDSETLIAAAIGHFTGTAGPRRILDLGTGPGTLLLAALDQWPRRDRDRHRRVGRGAGLCRAQCRAASASIRAPSSRIGNWADGIAERFDLVLINPPYVAEEAELGPGVAEYEPAEALFAGPDGLDDYRRLAPVIGRLIAPGGLAAIEIGHDQADSAAALFAAAGHDVRCRTTWPAGRARC